MKKLLFLALIVAAYYFHGRYTFSNDATERWIAQFSSRSMAGEQSACDDISDEVEVNIRAEDQRGTWEVDGSKGEVCGYMKQASAALTVLQASTHSEFHDFKVEPLDFFWRKVKVSYVERSSINVANMHAMESVSHDTLILARGFSGIKIMSLTSNSKTELFKQI